MAQQSIASLPEDQQEAALEATERASERYPSLRVAGYSLHVFEMDGEWGVWLNCEDHDFTGLCVAAGHTTRNAALAEAVHVLEAALDALQQPWGGVEGPGTPT